MIQSLPQDTFYASHNMYSTLNSYQVHNDVEFHKHIRMLNVITTNCATGSGNHDNIMSEHIDLFPPTVMIMANANKMSKEKNQKRTMSENYSKGRGRGKEKLTAEKRIYMTRRVQLTPVHLSISSFFSMCSLCSFLV